MFRTSSLVPWVLLACGLVAPAFLYPIFLMKALCFGLFASAFNLLLGYTGLLAFGHAMFFGSAAYAAGYLIKTLGWPPEAAILASVMAATLLGAAAGAIAIKREGLYFGMVTLALAELLYFVYVQSDFTGGEDGMQSIPRRVMLGVLPIANDLVLYYVVLALCAAGMFVVYRAIHSPFGHVLRAIRENEPRAISLGYRVERYKLLAFVISAALSGLAGATKVLVFQVASLTDTTWHMSGQVVLITLIGGMGTVWGPLLGAFVVVALDTYLADEGEWVLVIQGVIFVVVVMAFRRGILGELAAWLERRRAAAKIMPKPMAAAAPALAVEQMRSQPQPQPSSPVQRAKPF